MHSKSAPRRRHGGELKAQVLAECDGPGASVAAVAQTHGLNANLVHKWRRAERAKSSLTWRRFVDPFPGAAKLTRRTESGLFGDTFHVEPRLAKQFLGVGDA